jgi:hypothetical protein
MLSGGRASKMLKHRTIADANAYRLSHLLTELAKKIGNSLGHSGERAIAVPGLMLYRRTAPTLPNPSTYEPSLLVIAQGRIRVDLGKASYVFGQSKFLLTSIASTGDSLADYQFAISRPCETAKSWRLLPLNPESLTPTRKRLCPHGARGERPARLGGRSSPISAGNKSSGLLLCR